MKNPILKNLILKNPTLLHTRRARHFALKPLATVLLAALSAAAQAADTFADLGTLGGTTSSAYAVSADGAAVVGYGYLAGDASIHAFRWTQAGGMADLGTLGGTDSYARAVSADGAAVVGDGALAGDTSIHAFRWTQAGGMADLGTLGGTTSYAYAVSADGAAVVGEGALAGGSYHAFRWTQAGGMADLGTLGGTTSTARAVSADGAAVVGDGYLAGDTSIHAFRWTQAGGMADLGTLGGTNSYARAVSADGAAVVGGGALAGDASTHAFRWTQAGGMADLGTLGGTTSYANAVSADGAAVVGYGYLAGGASHAFRWTQAGGMADLGTLGGTYSNARAVSADGAAVVGYGYLAGDASTHAFRWTQAGGMQSVAAWLAGAGVTLPAGWVLSEATAVNGNGNVVVGNGSDPGGNGHGWLARVGPAGGGLLTDIPAFNATLIEAGSRAALAGAGLTNLALFGAHHRPLPDNGLARTRDGACGWATADAARQNNTHTRSELFEAGVCRDVGAARLGVGIGQTWARQDWSLGGGAKYDGQYLIAEATNAFANGMEGSVLGYYGRFSTELRRNYLNGATVDTSSGTPNAQSTALRLRFDWKDLTRLGDFSLSPYAAYTWIETRLDAYTETGGGFPAQFAASAWRTNDLRVGAAGKTALSAATDLLLGLEAAHRLDGSTNGVSGSVVGLPGLSFALAGQKVTQTWARATVDVDHRLTNTTALTFGANAASNGGDASWGVTAGLRMNF